MLDSTVTIRTQDVLDRLNAALEEGDIKAATALFTTDSYWRDLVAVTWNLKTVEGQDAVGEMLLHQLDKTQPNTFRLQDGELPVEEDGVTTAWVTFETKAGRGWGLMRLKDDRIWTLLTALQELKGFEENRGKRRPMGAEHGAQKNRLSWKERREAEEASLGYDTQPYTVIIGGGQGGIALGARLRQLGVPTIVLDKHDRPGDQWRSRYKSLCLHDPIWYDHLPYIKFPDNWPVFTPKDKVGDWLEMYTKVMEINYWTRSEVVKAAYNESAGTWTIEVNRDGETVILKPTQLVLATGMSGKPNVPNFPGMDSFKGEIQHSSQHKGPDDWTGKKVVVVGSNNSAHDICAALWEAEADVTMVQRSSTHIVKSDSLMDIGLGGLYSEEALANGVTTEKADMIFASLPYKIMHEFQIPLYDQMRERDAEFYAGLEKAGFQLDWGDDGSGLFLKYLRRGSGYYIDVGASQLIIDGEVKLVQGQVDHFEEDAVVLSDGTRLEADLVVMATGFGSMNGWAADLISQEVADKVGKVWGLGSDTTKDPGPWEGEQRNMWKPTQQENLWFHGGNLHQSRHYSLYLALQLKARMEGLETPVYGLQPVHHLS
ncbi:MULTISPECIES: NAD(P)/FAD-dependent oxidoreductase [Roseobacteraceae]|uniref:NAD(P)/FAD-dependent oxidoreductase n=1 Tax=Roseobacteraceae TaxID=2854170 RepID=UPI00125EACDD|nr:MULTISPECIES: NAD(P)/FAD-dependent oxidoreductase [Roseobacteraceae]KAB6716460.1 FAD-dependent oxidoreductase [Roseobacter sp. TSBP12]|tara:strand:+ start:3801 stop:5600 length:1800 start_codon:yes stop_codon:yes gene_type:complete